MIFSSLIFICYFLPLFLLFYYPRARNGMLVLGSAVFYIWGESAYLLLLVFLVVANFYIGRVVATATGNRRKWFLAGGITLDILVLGFFKYTGLIVGTGRHLIGLPPTAIDIHLPLGISFFTFQLISYLVDVGRQAIPGERVLMRFATYIMMFPHLIAGPIVRYADIDTELFKRSITLETLGLGVQYFIVGLCQKVLIANTVSIAADKVFAFPGSEITTPIAWLGVTAYTLQIYFDFCGYSNMAIGLAFLLGFRFPINFNYPYISRSLTEFWRRWHMSLSFWFRDYVYIPLGGNRGGAFNTLRNLVIVFFLTGLWHGASWTFALWGLFHGAFLLIERIGLGRALARLPAPVGWAYAMLVVMVGWVLFRATDLPHAATILAAMFGMTQANPIDPTQLWFTPEVRAAMVAGMVFSFPALPRLLAAMGRAELVGPVVPGTAHTQVMSVHAIPVPLLIVGLLLSAMLLVSTSLTPFLYFRF